MADVGQIDRDHADRDRLPQSAQRPRAVPGAGDATRAANYVSLVYFGGNPGWAKKLLPLGERADRVGQARTLWRRNCRSSIPIIVLPPDEADDLPAARGGLSAVRRAHQRAGMAQLADAGAGARARAARMDRAERCWRSAAGRLARGAGRSRMPIPADAAARERLAYDEVFANQLALMLVRASTRQAARRAAAGRRAAARCAASCPIRRPARRRARSREIEGDMAAGDADAAAAAGRCRIGQDAGRADGAAGRRSRPARRARCWRRPKSSRASIMTTLRQMLAGLPVNVAILTGRDKGRVREATLMGLADGSIDILVGTHAIFQEAVGYKRPRAGGGGRAASLRRRAADDAQPPRPSARRICW